MLDTLYWLDQIQSTKRTFVGSRAFYLSQILQRQYPVAPGFVVPAIAFWEFIKSLGKLEPILADLPHSSFHVDVDNPRQLQQVAQKIRQTIITTALPTVWTSSLIAAADVLQASPAMILRPSLSLASPSDGIPSNRFDPRPAIFNLQDNLHALGILDAHICPNHPEAIALALKRVWAELFRAKSLFYWQRQGIGLQQVNLAVLVQPLNNAIASGTLFANAAEWNIQATWGLGVAIVRGEVLPDSYQVQPDTKMLKTRSLGSKNRAYCLSNNLKLYTQSSTGVETYLLSEEQQQQYALEEKHFNQIISLAQRLTAEFGATFSLEWTLDQTPAQSEPEIYITQFLPHPVRSSQRQTASLTSATVKGLPAAAGRVMASAQVMMGGSKNLETMLPGRILVAQSIAPDWLPLLKQAVGIVTEQGGMTSHGAIVARELGIPAVVNVAGATQLIQTGDALVVDGDRGEIHRLGKGKTGTWESKTVEEHLTQSWNQSLHNPLPAQTIQASHYPIATQLLVNLSQVSSLEKIAGLPVDGVGLLRSELMMLEALENLHPSEWRRQGLEKELLGRLSYLIVQVAAAVAPRPVLYRSLDWRSHEFQSLSGATTPNEVEANPMLGRRGTLRYLSDPTYFDLELKALVQVHSYGYTNVHLMLPFVRTVEEFTFCRRRVDKVGLTNNPQFQLWIMAEVPSVLFLVPEYVKAGVQGISIGTNDLTQLLLAIDRDQGDLGAGLDGRHPAVMRAHKLLIEAAKNAGIPCSICGQATTQYPEIIDRLVKWGITSISVDVNDVERTHNAIARAEQRLLLEAARQKLKK